MIRGRSVRLLGSFVALGVGVAMWTAPSLAGNNSAPAILSWLRLPLLLKDEAMFFVNGNLILSNYPSAGNGTTPPTPATFDVNQMFVHYRSPTIKLHKTPI